MNSLPDEGADYDRWIDICGNNYNLGYVQKLGYCSSEDRKANKKAPNRIGNETK